MSQRGSQMPPAAAIPRGILKHPPRSQSVTQRPGTAPRPSVLEIQALRTRARSAAGRRVDSDASVASAGAAAMAQRVASAVARRRFEQAQAEESRLQEARYGRAAAGALRGGRCLPGSPDTRKSHRTC